MSARRFGLMLIAGASFLTCKDATGPSARVTLSGPASLELGDTARLSASVKDAGGVDQPTATRTWRSSNPGVATVDANGLVRTVAVGATHIEVTAFNQTAAHALTVTPGVVAAVVVTPMADSVQIGDSLQLIADARNRSGQIVPGRTVVWSSSDTSRGTVSATGLARARGVESFVIYATISGQVGGAFLRGQEAVASLRLPDTARVTRASLVTFIPSLAGASGSPITGRQLTWSVSDTVIATVNHLGTLNPKTTGTVRLTAACCGLGDTSVVIVEHRPLSVVSIATLPYHTLIAGMSLPIVAGARNDSFQDERVTFTWESSDTAVLTVSPDSTIYGVAHVLARRPGSARVRVAAGGRRDSVPLSVQLPVAAISLEPDTVAVRAGGFAQTHAVFRDSTGEFRGDAGASWRSLDTTIAIVSSGQTAIPRIDGRAPGVTGVVARLTLNNVIYEDTAHVVVSPTAANRFSWNVAEQFVDAFVPKTLQLTLTDSLGNPLTAGKDVTITAAHPSVTIGPAAVTALNGTVPIVVTGRENGRVTVTARTDTEFASFLLQTIRHKADSLSLTLPAIIAVGDSIQIGITVYTGAPVTPEAITWSVADPAVATVSTSGWLRAVGPGRVTVRAVALGAEDSTIATVRSAGGPVLDSVAPVLRAGAQVTVWGSGFSTTPAENVVHIAGLPAAVIAAQVDRLTVDVPPSTSFPCREPRSVIISVATPGGLDAKIRELSVATPIALGAGQATQLQAAAGRCVAIAAAGGTAEYGIAFTHAAPTGAVQTAITITGRPPGTPVAVAAEVELNDVPPVPASIPMLERARATARLHQTILAENRRFSGSVGAPMPHLRNALRPLSSVRDSINDLVRIRIPDVTRPDFCTNHYAITARRAYVGSKVVIYEDVSSVLAGAMDADYAALGAEFDTVMYPLLLSHYGNPLALDSLLDGNGRLAMVFSPWVNTTGAAGFVVTCDFYPEHIAPSSNTGEMFYAVVPTSTATTFAPGSVQEWRWLIRSVVMHEAKHVTAVAERLARGGLPEQSWLEEGSAVLAEEFWSRGVYGTTWKGNVTYNQTIACDVRPIQCPGKPYAMFNAFAYLHDYAVAQETHTPLGSVDPSDGSFYGSAWLWLRWLIDHFATDEAAFVRSFTQDISKSGVQHFASLVPEGWPGLAAEWALANQLDDSPLGTVRPRQQHPSWNLPEIFTGMSFDFPPFFQPAPFRMRSSSFGAFQHTVNGLRGGTSAVLRVSGTQSQIQVIEISSSQGAMPPLQIEIVRVRD